MFCIFEAAVLYGVLMVGMLCIMRSYVRRPGNALQPNQAVITIVYSARRLI